MAFLLILRHFFLPCLQIAMKKFKLKRLKPFWKFAQKPFLVVNCHLAALKEIFWMNMMMMMKRRFRKVMRKIMMMRRLRKVRQMMHLHGSHQREMPS